MKSCFTIHAHLHNSQSQWVILGAAKYIYYQKKVFGSDFHYSATPLESSKFVQYMEQIMLLNTLSFVYYRKSYTNFTTFSGLNQQYDESTTNHTPKSFWA